MCMSMVCGAGCGEAEFRCADGRCIGYELQCNGVEECSDGSDERDCGNYDISRHILLHFTLDTYTEHSRVSNCFSSSSEFPLKEVV